MPDATSTPRPRIVPSVYANAEAGRLLARWWWLPTMALVACAISGFDDNRWWFLGLMLLFVVFPILMSMAWMAILSRPQIHLLTHPYSIESSSSQIAVLLYPFTEDASEPIAQIIVTQDNIRNIEHLKRYMRISLNTPQHGVNFLLIPHEAITPVPQFLFEY